MGRALFVLAYVLSTLGPVFVAAWPQLTHGADSEPQTWTRKPDPLAPARRAIEAKDWDGAIQLLTAEKERQPTNADVFNLLGFAERNRGNLDAAFAWYEKALTIDPKHRGAHEYVGETYLLAGNVAKAKEHLAALDKLCPFSCEEYRDLRDDIAKYEKEHPK
jgi:tetratricopeptide (TPR) repeat protein